MDAARFDAWTRIAGGPSSRRAIVAGLFLALVGPAALDEAAGAPLRGLPTCKPPGRKCRKKADCCDQICTGKKHKKRCRQRACQAGQAPDLCGGTLLPCTTTAALPGRCATTASNQGYCARSITCIACTVDADCTASCGPDAACIDCIRSEADCGGARTKVCAGPDSCEVP